MKLLLILMMALFTEANEQYAAGNYQEAATMYEQVVSEQPAAEAYYNLGNAYFKMGEVAQAILAYERCLRLDPQNKDAKNNLQFAEARVVDNIEDTHRFFLLQWAQAFRNWLSEPTWLILSVSLFIVVLTMLFVFFFTHPMVLRKVAFHTAWLSLVLSVVTLWCGLSLHHRDQARAEAIVTQGIVNAKSSPDKSGTDLFVLHEGTKVHITQTVADWCEIRVGDNIGWLRLSSVERI